MKNYSFELHVVVQVGFFFRENKREREIDRERERERERECSRANQSLSKKCFTKKTEQKTYRVLVGKRVFEVDMFSYRVGSCTTSFCKPCRNTDIVNATNLNPFCSIHWPYLNNLGEAIEEIFLTKHRVVFIKQKRITDFLKFTINSKSMIIFILEEKVSTPAWKFFVYISIDL